MKLTFVVLVLAILLLVGLLCFRSLPVPVSLVGLIADRNLPSGVGLQVDSVSVRRLPQWTQCMRRGLKPSQADKCSRKPATSGFQG